MSLYFINNIKMKTVKVILWVIWFIAVSMDLFIAVMYAIEWDMVKAIYYLLFVIFLLLCVKN